MVTDRLAPAREAFARQDWKRAYAALSVADDTDAQIGVEDLERLAISAYMLGKDEVSAGLWAPAFLGVVALHDVRRAARCTFWLVLDLHVDLWPSARMHLTGGARRCVNSPA
jgi:hypothetical protein